MVALIPPIGTKNLILGVLAHGLFHSLPVSREYWTANNALRSRYRPF